MAFASAAPSTSAQDPKRSEIALVESAFVGKSLSEINLALAMVRPAAVSQADKLLLMSDLPFLTTAKEIKDKGQLERLRDRVGPVLKLFGRDGVVELVFFRDPRPIVYSKPGVVVAISTEVLKIVGNDDVGLAGIVAHELAHEYVALQMLQAVQAHDLARIRELELFCDAVAVVSLVNLGLDPAHYAKALKGIANHSQAATMLNDGSNTHPNVETRLRIVSDISVMLRSSSAQTLPSKR